MFDLTAFQRDLLFIIAGLDEPHGLGIKDELEAVYETDVNHGRLYPNLNTLVEKNLVAKGTIDKRTNSYSITARGEELLTHRRAWEAEYIDHLLEAE